jgi:hypothetical protein
MENINQLRKYICDNTLELNKENKKNIYCFLKNKINDNYITQNSDGIRIDLNNLDDALINELYNLVVYKINDEKKK